MPFLRRPIVALPKGLRIHIPTLCTEGESRDVTFRKLGIGMANRRGSLHDYPATEDMAILRLPRGTTRDRFSPQRGNNCEFWKVAADVYLFLLEDMRPFVADVADAPAPVALLGLYTKAELLSFLAYINPGLCSWLLTDITESTLIELGFTTREALDRMANAG